METIQFASAIGYWKPEKAGGLAVAEIPAEHIQALGGLKQQCVRGVMAGTEFASNVMPAAEAGSR